MDANYCTFYIVRHGQAELNRDHIVMGQLDSPLTELGQQQARALETTFKEITFDAVLVSDLQRAIDTARIITNSDGAHFHINKDLRERSFGDLEGKPVTELEILREQSKDLSAEQKWTIKLNGMESDQELYERVSACLRSFSNHHPHEKVLVATHSGPIRTLLMGLGFYGHGELESGFIGHGKYVVIQMNGSHAVLKGVYAGNADQLTSTE